jgi:hypothetical protein
LRATKHIWGRKYRSDYKETVSEEEVDYKLTNPKANKGAVLGLADRQSGKIRVLRFPAVVGTDLKKAIKENVAIGSEVHTDESYLYRNGLEEYNHKTVHHGKHQWSVNGVHTNNVECFWSVMKRGVYGIYHQISYKHLQAYCNEFAYRYNSRKMTDGDRFSLVLQGLEGRLTYKQLIHGKNSQEESNQSAQA